MMFEVRRRCNWQEKPCDEAVRRARSEIDAKNADPKETEEATYWTIQIESIESLIRFQNKYGNVLIHDDSVAGLKLIEIP
ncbi:hypothetical protein IMZ31_23990 (plasmid) [Pontibacillus sp. ALD_SL1]|uniref:hypothetical protein n=1 Tax=Pontibacillus sp. ALD_SL1 TaxID=2777185 RepID=UPI001A974D67|nr:hypothetical protein [Pontibacillus sp. ALD_SL1]QST02514.1 hypothetical protein IMZ31_23990 [Pontibacillus sp. ALD_SL1]